MVKRKNDSDNSSSNKKKKIDDDENIKTMIKKVSDDSDDSKDSNESDDSKDSNESDSDDDDSKDSDDESDDSDYIYKSADSDSNKSIDLKKTEKEDEEEDEDEEETFEDKEFIDNENDIFVIRMTDDTNDAAAEDELTEIAKFLTSTIFKNINQQILDEEQFDENKDGEESVIENKKDDKYTRTYTRDETKYLKTLSSTERKKIKNSNKEVVDYFESGDMPLKIKILKSNISLSAKSSIIDKINTFNKMSTRESEYGKMKKYMTLLEKIPFNTYIQMPIKKNETKLKINSFIKQSYKYLEDSIYGQEETKIKILEILARWISKPESSGAVLALEGPPGVGKTTILKNGLAKALNRPIAFIPLGGATDSSFLVGHNYTYEGAICGKIANIVMETKCMNPIIFFDELDKVSGTKHGEEIIGVLTHLTDPTQNDEFYDKYFSSIPLDLSKCLIVFSYNDPQKINPILKDRLTIIKVPGFKTDDKIKIATDYLLKDILENIGLKKGSIIIDNESLKYIINTFTVEEGVRELKRCLDTIIMKINLMRYSDIKLNYRITNIKFPYTLTKKDINGLLEMTEKEEENESWKQMYI